ncbi:short chain dehydrogenase [Serratia fonticola]|uniref:Short chain dehydrogenase n=1 Tax=Serratia fonticola TaxID=47917 RepID=A0A3S4YDV9_SERFO|nr:short chain dehydrogenase [Serratia fonticola]
MSGLLAGKRIVVTGAARGLGRSFAAAVAQAGASVVMCDILAEELQDSAASLREQGHRLKLRLSIWLHHNPSLRRSVRLPRAARSTGW